MSETSSALRPVDISLPRLFVKFLGFGSLAFGGPVAQIAMLRTALVEREQWISSARFNRLLAVMQALPGPEAHELCVHLGMVARGRAGGLLAGLGFMLPGLLLMLLAGWAYTAWVKDALGQSAALLGVQIVVLAIIVRAVVRIGHHILDNRWLVAIAVAALAVTVAGVPFWISLVTAGACCAVPNRPLPIIAVIAAAAIAAFAVHDVGSAEHIAPGGSAPTMAALFLAGLKGGLLTFGGAYTAIPYVRADTVERGWIADATFLDGIALAGVLPAPLVIFATFVGYVVGGPAGGLAITAGMFLPAFAFSLVLYERLEAIVDTPALHGLLSGIAAAAVGIIAATVVQIAGAAAARVPATPAAASAAAALFVVALATAWRIKGGWVTPALLVGGGLSGWLLS